MLQKVMGVVAASALLCSITPNATLAQGVSCTDCAIEIHKISNIVGEWEHTVPLPHVAALSNGSFFLSFPGQRPRLYNESGHASKSMTLPLASPGTWYLVATGASDTVYLLDPYSRTLVTASPDGMPIHQHRVEAQLRNVWGNIAVHGDAILASGVVLEPAHVGQPIHRIRRNGAIERSFGAQERTYRFDQARRLHRLIAVISDQSIWSVDRNAGLLEHWDTQGNALASIPLPVISSENYKQTHLDDPSLDVVAAAMGPAPGGHLWLLYNIWQPNEGPLSHDHSSHGEPDFIGSFLFLLDGSNGSVLGAQFIKGPERAVALVGSDRLLTISNTPDRYTMALWGVSIN